MLNEKMRMRVKKVEIYQLKVDSFREGSGGLITGGCADAVIDGADAVDVERGRLYKQFFVMPDEEKAAKLKDEAVKCVIEQRKYAYSGRSFRGRAYFETVNVDRGDIDEKYIYKGMAIERLRS